MSTLETIVALIFTPTAIVGGIVLILRKFFEQALSRDIEKYKTNLHTEFEHSKIRLENELQTRFFEYQTKFSSYHQRRAEVIGELYGLLSDTVECVRDLIHPVQLGEKSQAEKNQEAKEKYNKLGQYYIRNRIYLEEDICDGMETIFKTMKLAIAKFRISQEAPTRSDLDLWNEAWKSIEDEVPPLLKMLERSFRRSLSVESRQDDVAALPETKARSV